jgi:hypothetical protein
MPPAITAMNLNEKTYWGLIGPLGEKPSVAVEALFVDPLSDLAVLGPPDDQNYMRNAKPMKLSSNRGCPYH